jgi:hypothetical protein
MAKDKPDGCFSVPNSSAMIVEPGRFNWSVLREDVGISDRSSDYLPWEVLVEFTHHLVNAIEWG